MTPRIVVTVGGRTARSVLAGLDRLPVDVWAAVPSDLTDHAGALPSERLITLGSSGGRDLGEEVLEAARVVRADAVIPTGDCDLRATAELAWVFDLRGVALAAPAPWTLANCSDAAALQRVWQKSGGGEDGEASARPGEETWWDVVVDREGGLRWVHSRGAPADPGGARRIGAVARALGLRYAASLCTRVDGRGRRDLIQVVPRFTPALGPVLARGVGMPRLVLEVLLGRKLARARADALTAWPRAEDSPLLRA
jgi:hypothetical protein